MIDRIVDTLAVVGAILLCTLTGLICIDVMVRYFKWFSIGWTLDVAEYHLYAITFCAAPWVLRTQGHIAVDLLVQHLSGSVAVWFARLSYCLGGLICSVLLVYSLIVLWNSYSAETLIYKALIIPEWPLFTLPPVTFTLMALIFWRWFLHPPAGPDFETDGL